MRITLTLCLSLFALSLAARSANACTIRDVMCDDGKVRICTEDGWSPPFGACKRSPGNDVSVLSI